MISLFPHLHIPFSPSLISLVVSADVRHHVYLLVQQVYVEMSPVSVCAAACGTDYRGSCVPVAAGCVSEDLTAMCPVGTKCCTDGYCHARPGQVHTHTHTHTLSLTHPYHHHQQQSKTLLVIVQYGPNSETNMEGINIYIYINKLLSYFQPRKNKQRCDYTTWVDIQSAL